MKHKKTLIVLIGVFILFFQFAVQAQKYVPIPSDLLDYQHNHANEKTKIKSWPPDSAEWYYEVQSLFGCYPCYISYQNSKIVGDTIILSKECKILQKYNASEICDNMGNITEFIYEENNKVYWYNRILEHFTLLYDFSAKSGDSWEIFVNSCSLIVNIDSISSLFINNQDYRVQHVSDENHYFTGDIIENIGHTTSMFPKDIYWVCQGVGCDSDFINGLRCYLINDIIVYKKDENPCDTTYQIFISIKENKCNSISFYPNPLRETLNIDIKNSGELYSDELYYNLFNSTGTMIKGGLLPKSKSLNLSGLKPGLYSIHLLLDNKIIHKQKIIKQ